MQDEYLPIGYKIGGHYQIVKVLGDDEFEIVYVVKDIHRLGTLFVLKELFLKEYSFRDEENGVYILEKSKESFQKTKERVISEVNLFREKGDKNSVRTYGYFEENNTLYTILEFIDNGKLDSYLKIVPKNSTKEVEPKVEVNVETEVKKEKQEEKKKEKPKSYLFLKMLIASIILFIGLGIYAYKMIDEDKNRPRETTVATTTKAKTVIPHPPLIDRTKKREERVAEEAESHRPPTITKTQETQYIPPKEDEKIEIDAGVPTEEIMEVEKDEPTKTLASEDVIEVKKEEPKKTIPLDDMIEVKKEEPKKAIPLDDIEIVYVPPKRATTHNNNISLGRRITNTDNNGPRFNREEIQSFLEDFLASTEGSSIDRILSFYDTYVDRYFSLRGATHKNIYQDKIRYNRKWVHRSFKLLDFKILNISKINDTEYCDIRKRTKWAVSTRSGLNKSGTSKVFMVLKRTPSGFKIKTIYSFK